MKIVSYSNNDGGPVKTGEVVKEGSKFIFVRERNTPRPQVVKLNIKDNHVSYLLGDKNGFKTKKTKSAKKRKQKPTVIL